jgi:hypothetical protein
MYTLEKENIDTGDSKGELLLIIMSSLSQEESRPIEKGADDLPQIVKHEVIIVSFPEHVTAFGRDNAELVISFLKHLSKRSNNCFQPLMM